MKLLITSAALLCAVLYATCERPVMAQNAAHSTAGTTAGLPSAPRQLAFLSPMEDLQVLRQSAADSYRRMQYTDAAGAYKRICQSPTSSNQDLYMLAEALYHCGQNLQSAQYFDQVANRDQHFDAARVRAVSAYIAGKQTSTGRTYCANALHLVGDPYSRSQLKVLYKLVSGSDFQRPDHNRMTSSGTMAGEQ